VDTREVTLAYRKLGWQVAERDGRLELVTGAVVDVLEVPRAAGLLASRWWLYTDGAADEIRGLPSMPRPAEAMALIAAGDRSFFLAQAGTCPWITQDPVITDTSDRADRAVIRWHSDASRIPFPPGRTDDGHEVAWEHLPARGIRLACPAILLHLLATAIAALRRGPGMLTLPGDVLAIPVLGDGPAERSAASRPAIAQPRPAIPFGFRGDQ
jgi:hypothetical protein